MVFPVTTSSTVITFDLIFTLKVSILLVCGSFGKLSLRDTVTMSPLSPSGVKNGFRPALITDFSMVCISGNAVSRSIASTLIGLAVCSGLTVVTGYLF